MKFLPIKINILLLLIVFLGAIFRFYGVNWDQNFHLHPDERFLTMVATAISFPTAISTYFNPEISPASPYNNNYSFFVYGSFPLYATKLLAQITLNDNYNGITLVGRFLSAIFDLGTIILTYNLGIFLSSQYLKKGSKSFGLIAALLFTTNVFAIQQSHFFTVDSFLTFFVTLTIYCLIKGHLINNPIPFFLLAAVFFGFAVASKIIVLFFLPFFLLFISGSYILRYILNTSWRKSITPLFCTLLIASLSLVFLIISYVTFRVIQPFYFSNGNFFDISLNSQTVNSFQQLMAMDSPLAIFPPAYQWLSKPSLIWPLQQMFLFGLNPFVTLFGFSGILFYCFYFIRSLLYLTKRGGLSIFLGHLNQYYVVYFLSIVSIIFFLYQATRYTMNMRYFYPIYPEIILFSVAFIQVVIKNTRIAKMLLYTMITASFIWSLSFLHIYQIPHSRITASKWIYSHIPSNSIIAVEHWDDALPLHLPYQQNATYMFEELPVFDQENSHKWEIIKRKLMNADYYILSSNRAWGSMPLMPKQFPKTSLYYNMLFAEELGLKKVAEFTSRPTLGGIEINDDFAEESFTVYDHPIVLIYKITDKQTLGKKLDLLMY